MIGGVICGVRFVLAAMSFVCFRLFRWLAVRRIANAFFALDAKSKRGAGGSLGAASLRNPLALPVFMTSAPRWNPHAILATAGPLRVLESLTVDVAEAGRAAASWSLVIYTFPGFKTVTTLDRANSGEEMRTVSLAAGRYWLGMRYYRWSAQPVLPAVLVDGQAVVAALPVPGDLNGFYADLARRRSVFYFLPCHYYVWVLLRYASHLPRKWVEREYVQVGNPGTRFLYGYVYKVDLIRVGNGTRTVGYSRRVLVTVYSRCKLYRYHGIKLARQCISARPCGRHADII